MPYIKQLATAVLLLFAPFLFTKTAFALVILPVFAISAIKLCVFLISTLAIPVTAMVGVVKRGNIKKTLTVALAILAVIFAISYGVFKFVLPQETPATEFQSGSSPAFMAPGMEVKDPQLKTDTLIEPQYRDIVTDPLPPELVEEGEKVSPEYPENPNYPTPTLPGRPITPEDITPNIWIPPITTTEMLRLVTMIAAVIAAGAFPLAFVLGVVLKNGMSKDWEVKKIALFALSLSLTAGITISYFVVAFLLSQQGALL